MEKVVLICGKGAEDYQEWYDASPKSIVEHDK